MFADAMPDHLDTSSIAPSVSPPTLNIPSFSVDDPQSDMEFPRLSDAEEDMLVKVEEPALSTCC